MDRALSVLICIMASVAIVLYATKIVSAGGATGEQVFWVAVDSALFVINIKQAVCGK